MSLHRSIRLLALTLAVGLVAIGCSGPPEKALDSAEAALLDARGKSECAEEKFQAAQKLFDEAKKLSEEGEYDAAERKARAAEKLAKQAKQEAEDNWEECQRRKRLARQARGEEEDDSEDDGGQDQPIPELRTVYFGYDSADLSDDSRQVLKGNARWIKHNSTKTVVVEGHTDERGSVEYNLALGERRANIVKQYLVQLGVDGERLYTLSYGEEKPAAYGSTSSDYAKNRRVEFVPKRKD